MPVIDSIGRLLGRITVDDVMDKVRDSSERDYQLASGLSGDVESDDKLFAQTKARLPWLLIGMVGGLCNSVILGRFEGGFVVDPALALFIPLIGGTGGNVGTQSSAIVVQGLANGSLDIKKSSRQLLKELGVGLLNGSIIALLVFLYNFFTLGAGHEVTTFAVSISIFCVVMFASVFGTFVPLTLEKLKIDPAIATGPFISITNDIIGMLIYMSISTCSSSSSPTDHPTGGVRQDTDLIVAPDTVAHSAQVSGGKDIHANVVSGQGHRFTNPNGPGPQHVRQVCSGQATGCGLELAEFDHCGHALHYGILAVLVGVIIRLEIHAEETAEGLPESGAKTAEECFQNIVARLVGLAVYELDKHLGLRLGKLLQGRLILLEHLPFHAFQMLLALLLGGECLDVFIGLDQRLADEFGIGERLFDIAHGFPVELLLLLVFELEGRKHGDIGEHQHQGLLAVLASKK